MYDGNDRSQLSAERRHTQVLVSIFSFFERQPSKCLTMGRSMRPNDCLEINCQYLFRFQSIQFVVRSVVQREKYITHAVGGLFSESTWSKNQKAHQLDSFVGSTSLVTYTMESHGEAMLIRQCATQIDDRSVPIIVSGDPFLSRTAPSVDRIHSIICRIQR